ncbi:MAG: HNH endonuclease family protein [Actinomycetota bacterium]
MPDATARARRSAAAVTALAAAAALLLTGCAPDESEASGGSAEQAALQALPVRAEPDGFEPTAFGPDDTVSDADGNGCPLRSDVLVRDLENVETEPGSTPCAVRAGQLTDLYTGEAVDYTAQRPDAVQVDRIVSLTDAWASGAGFWTAEQRGQFAADLDNVQLVADRTFRDRAGADAGRWLPPQESARCDLVAHQVAVKTEWDLSVDEAEKTAMAEVLAGC